MTTLVHQLLGRETTMPAEIFGLKLSALIWGLIGGATAAMFGPASWTNRVLTTAVGTIVSTAFGPFLVSAFHAYITRYIEVSRDDILPPVIFLCGLTGMWACAIIIEFLKRVKNDPGILVARFSKTPSNKKDRS
jgi:hypothetical protein